MADCPEEDLPVLSKIYNNRVFVVEEAEGGMFTLTECCDDFFSVELPASELKALGHELIKLAQTKEAS